MPDEPFRGEYGIITSADRWYAVTPDDDADLPVKPRMVRVNVGGNVVMRDANGTTVTFAFLDGQSEPLSPHRILATGTTATGIVACW